MTRYRRRQGSELRDQRPLFKQLPGQPPMPAGIDLLNPRRHHRNAHTRGLQGTPVGSAIDTQGQATGDCQPRPRQVAGNLSRQIQAGGAGLATADDGQLRVLQSGG